MTEHNDNDEYWQIKCSVGDLTDITGEWEPLEEEIERVYALIDKNGPFQLEWRCPGYRSPSPVTPTTPIQKEPENTQREEKADDFDFMDEMSSPSLRVRREGDVELKGSAKKKTTSLDDVLSNMRRHWRLQQMEKETVSPTPEQKNI